MLRTTAINVIGLPPNQIIQCLTPGTTRPSQANENQLFDPQLLIDHINNAYYKTFEEDATIWTDRLNRMSEIFDKWIDVQRQWVYLEGIFSGNADIKHLLPNESNRFNNINAEYLGLMKRVFKSPYVLDVIQIPELLKTLDKLVESLGKLQKALGEYLERERSSFPRFYFVGDEDLLEILGNSKLQSLNQVLRAERPDTDKKRTDLMRLQGEFKLRLRHLEKLLLQALSESTGNILDDDKVIVTLETLKREAADVAKKVEETDIIMQEVDQVTAEYLPLAQASSSIFFVLEQLNVLNHFYQFSLRYFLDIFEFVLLHNPNLVKVQGAKERLAVLLNDIFVVTFKRTSSSFIVII